MEETGGGRNFQRVERLDRRVLAGGGWRRQECKFWIAEVDGRCSEFAVGLVLGEAGIWTANAEAGTASQATTA